VKTELLRCGTTEEVERAVTAAVDLLRRGEAVALPTETVYGLAADALSPDAALKIFEAKERPRFDPLIVHLPDADSLQRVARVDAAEQELVSRLADRFWPGPLTLVLPRQPMVPDVVTAGLETVAVRVSAHAIFGRIVRGFGAPVAAPSANRFGRVSPTTAEHVRAELEGRIPLIVDGGRTEHGIESTIVAVRNGALEVLRPGPITREQLTQFGEVRAGATTRAQPEAPGQLASHYAPRTRVVLSSRLISPHGGPHPRVGALSWRGTDAAGFEQVRVLSASGDLREAASNLFRYLRELDDAELDVIVAEELPDVGLGNAIMDRLRRAAARP
jgi:L-threonylcarbamoyladenylate synthase